MSQEPQEICKISFDEQTLKDDLGNYTYANNLSQSDEQYVENGDGFALSAINLWRKNGPYFYIDATSEFYHQIKNSDYFEISFDMFFTHVAGYASHICCFGVFDDTTQRSIVFGNNIRDNLSTAIREWGRLKNIVANQWYTFKIVVNNKNHVTSIYQDDVLLNYNLKNNYHFVPTTVGIGALNNEVDSTAYVDNISITAGMILLPPTVEITQRNNILIANATADSNLEDKTVSYLWNTGETTQFIHILEAGTYSCTVTDSIGKSSTESIVVENVEHSYTSSIKSNKNNPIVFGEDITLSASLYDEDTKRYISEADVSYLWDTGETSKEIIVRPFERTRYTVSITYENKTYNASYIATNAKKEFLDKEGLQELWEIMKAYMDKYYVRKETNGTSLTSLAEDPDDLNDIVNEEINENPRSEVNSN